MSDSTSSRRPLRVVLIVVAVLAVIAAAVATLQLTGTVSFDGLFAGFKAL